MSDHNCDRRDKQRHLESGDFWDLLLWNATCASRVCPHGLQMTQMPSPDSSTMPRESHARTPLRFTRLRSVLLVAVVSSLVALALGVTGAVGLWYRAQPTADSTGHDQPSLHTVAGRALTGRVTLVCSCNRARQRICPG